MEHIAGTAGGTTYTAAETGKALLEAMDAEEPFKLLSALPRRLEELRTIQGHLESTERQLASEIALSQSQNCDSISSGSSQIREWKDELGSMLDLHAQRLQHEADGIQESLEDLCRSRQPETLLRRSRILEKSFGNLSNELSELQDTNERILEIFHYVYNVAEELVADKESLFAIIHQIAHEASIVQGDCNICMCSSRPLSPNTEHEARGEAEERRPDPTNDMEMRCKELEAAILRNNATIEKQTQEIDRLLCVSYR